MKILVVHNAYQSKHIGGEDIVVAREIEGLKAVLGKEQIFEYSQSNDGIRAWKLLKNIWGDRSHARAIADLVKTHQIDIVHIHNFFPLLTPSIFKAAKAAGAKVIHTLHNFRWWCAAGTLYRPGKGNCMDCVNKKWGYPAAWHGCYRGSHVQSLAASLAFYWYQLKKYRDAIDAYFVLTEFQKQKLAECQLNDKIWLKPNPIAEPETIVPVSDKKDYLFVGRLEPAKGIVPLLKIWQHLPQQFVLHVVGEGELKQQLMRHYNSKNIHFHGSQPHTAVLKRMAKARYFIHTGLAYETFGLTLVEALAQGTPVIAFNKGTRAELIQHGHNGYLSDECGLRDVILNSYAASDYATLSENARAFAQSFLLPPIMARQVALYRDLLGAPA